MKPHVRFKSRQRPRVLPMGYHDAGIRRHLTDMLTEVDGGDVTALAYALSYRDGTTAQGWSGVHMRPALLLGSMRLLEREFIDNAIDLSTKPAGGGYGDEP